MDDQGVLKEQQEEIFPIMKENYDGYKFSFKAKEKIIEKFVRKEPPAAST